MKPFHEGEIRMQERAGERDIARKKGRIIGDTIPEGARPFLGRQRMIVVAHEEQGEHLSAAIRFGDLGFVASSADGRSVRFEEHGLPAGAPVGLLALDFLSRKRLRVNGVCEAPDRIRVREAYPNCPKYIQRWILREAEPIDRGGIEEGIALDAARIETLRRTDTFFLASRHPERGLDASHRGGPPGFVRVVEDGSNTLIVPDYPGNGMFNSLGNFEIDPAAAIALLDFERGRILQLHGHARTIAFEDERCWTFQVHGWKESPAPATHRWDLLDRSPYNP